MKSKRRGRPRKAGALPVDPASIDPKAILAGIAVDVNTPPTARVSAAKALLGLDGGQVDAPSGSAAVLSARALKMIGERLQ